MLTATPVSTPKDFNLLGEKYLTKSVDVFNAWTYTRTLPACVKYETEIDNKWQMLLAKVYVFGDRFNIPGLKSAALNMQKTNASERQQPWGVMQPPCCKVIKFVYENLPENDTFMQLLVNNFCCGDKFTNAEQAENELRSFPHGLLVKIIMEYNENKQ